VNKEQVILEIQFDGADKALKENQALAAEQKKLIELNKQLKSVGKENSDQYQKNASDIRVNSKVMRENNRVIDANNRANQANKGSITQLRQQLSQATVAYNNLSASERDNTKAGQDLKKQIKSQSDELKRLEGNVGNNTRNVGNYQSALQGLPAPLAAATTGIRAMTTAAKAFIATPLGLTLAAIGAAFGAVIAYLKGSAEGQERLNKVTTFFSTLLGTVMDLVRDAGELLVNLFSNPKEALLDFGNLIKQNIINRFQGILELIPNLGKSIKLLFSGQFSEAGKVALDSVGKVVTGLESVSDTAVSAFDAIKEKVKEVAEEVAKDTKQGQELADRQNALRRKEIDLLTSRAKLESEIAEARLDANDKENKSAAERLAASEKAQELTKQLFAEEKTIAKERLALTQLENSLSDSKLEDLEKEAQLKADLIRLDKSQADGLRELQEKAVSNRLALEKEEADRIKKDEADRKEAQEKLLAETEETTTRLIEQEKNRYLEGQISKEQYEQSLFDIELAGLLLRADLEAEFGEMSLATQTEITDAKISQKEREVKAKEALDKLEIANEQSKQASIANSLAQGKALFNKDSAAYKALAIAEATQSTYLAANKALAASPPPLNFINSGIAIATGIANVAKIASANIPKLEKGGLIPVGGKPHSQGGTKFVGSDGTAFEAEAEETIAVVNKNARGHLAALSNVNQLTGGAAFGNPKNYLNDGGIVARSIQSNSNRGIESAIGSLKSDIADLQLFVSVTDINNSQSDLSEVQNVATVTD
jgi:hypothetical protein